MMNYAIKSTNESSAKYGDCEICHTHCSEVFHRTSRNTVKLSNGDTCRPVGPDVFGHQSCLAPILFSDITPEA